jgi:deazaflavin-dependent oxidoreductase (nitroreductase family)
VFNPYRAVLLRWATHKSYIPFVTFLGMPMDKLTRHTGRPFSSIGTGLPTVHLTTTGRNTGQQRTVPVFGLDIGSGVALINSNFGKDAPPGWYFNLVADPRCRLQRGRELSECEARAATAEERAEIWRKAVAVYPAWETYRRRTDREFDMFVLEPR